MEKEYHRIKIEEFFKKKKTKNPEKTIDFVTFPDFQREPTVWSLRKKQRLIDSILRDFDIFPFYFYNNENEGTFDCIDGKQRIHAILSFFGDNPTKGEGVDNNFSFKSFNEIYEDESLKVLDGLRYTEFPQEFIEKIRKYELNIVGVSKVVNDEELNLQFLRLQFASILNAGEKLHAMTGDMRDFVFDKIGGHDFFKELSIPYRRYAKEQVCAQICLNVFNRGGSNDKRRDNKGEEIFYRCRYEDLQDLFKKYKNFSKREKDISQQIENNLGIIHDKFGDKLNNIRNRAIAVSVYFFVEYLIEESKKADISVFSEFIIELMKTLKWQIKKGVGMNHQYYYLLEFQSNITQAAVEGYAIKTRDKLLKNYFDFYRENKFLKGDEAYKKEYKEDPAEIRDGITL